MAEGITSDMYTQKRRFGRLGKANVEDSDSDDNKDPDLIGKTPNTKRKVKDEKIKKEIKKLGTWQTFLTLLKSFVCTSVLYMPKAFVNGGWLMTSIMLSLSACMTIFCGLLLLEVRKKTGLANYS